MRRTFCSAAAVLVAVVAVVGCGGDGEGEPSSVTTTVTVAVPVSPQPAQPSRPRTPLPRTTLRVADDGCGVIRAPFHSGDPEGLQWVVTDDDGFEVLGRNARNELRYRYYRAGRYEVALEAWEGSEYADVSNRVSIRCP